MNSFWSTYRQAWMIAVNAFIDSQKLLLAQTKLLLADARSAGAPSPSAAGVAEPVARPALAAQAAGEHRLEQTARPAAAKPSGKARHSGRRARTTARASRRRRR